MDPGSLAARSMTLVGSLQPALFLPRPQGTAGRSSRLQLCDTLQAPMASPAAGWLRAKVTQSLGGQRGAAPHAPRQLSFACSAHQQDLLSSSLPCTGCIPVPLVPRRSSRCGCWESSCLWDKWCGLVGYLQEAFLTPRFSYGGLLNFQLYSNFLGISTLQLGCGPITQRSSSGVGQEGCSRNGL